jgi:tRNA(fMet)-specific endonuclease VapC
MGKNDLWIAATSLYLDMEIHTKDQDFTHLATLGLRLVNHLNP